MGKKGNRRSESSGELNITSMMDMMTIILVFLLKSYSTTDVSVAPSDDLMIPLSSAQKPPKMAVNVVVSQKQIIVDGVPVMSLGRFADENGREVVAVPSEEKQGQMIPKLFDRLQEKAEIAKELEQRAGEDHGFKGQILLQCDKRLPFSLIREVMYTAGQAQFGEFRFVVIKGGE